MGVDDGVGGPEVVGGLALPSVPSSETGEKTGGLSLESGAKSSVAGLGQRGEVIGGLALSGPDTSGGPVLGESKREFDPLSLLKMDEMGVDAFFDPDRTDDIYNTMRRLVTLPFDDPNRQKAEKILELVGNGEKEFRKRNPDADKVKFGDKVGS